MSLAVPSVYSIPMLLLVGWRGEPGKRDEPQHMIQGQATPGILGMLVLPHTWLHRLVLLLQKDNHTPPLEGFLASPPPLKPPPHPNYHHQFYLLNFISWPRKKTIRMLGFKNATHMIKWFIYQIFKSICNPKSCPNLSKPTLKTHWPVFLCIFFSKVCKFRITQYLTNLFKFKLLWFWLQRQFGCKDNLAH